MKQITEEQIREAAVSKSKETLPYVVDWETENEKLVFETVFECGFSHGVRQGAKWMQEQDGWVDVNERLPDERVDVLVLKPTPYSSVKHRIYIDRLVDGYFFRSPINEVTHWKPLPGLPKQ